MILTRKQRVALRRAHQRHVPDTNYREFRRTVSPLLGDSSCAMVYVPGMWLGIESNGETHT